MSEQPEMPSLPFGFDPSVFAEQVAPDAEHRQLRERLGRWYQAKTLMYYSGSSAVETPFMRGVGALMTGMMLSHRRGYQVPHPSLPISFLELMKTGNHELANLLHSNPYVPKDREQHFDLARSVLFYSSARPPQAQLGAKPLGWVLMPTPPLYGPHIFLPRRELRHTLPFKVRDLRGGVWVPLPFSPMTVREGVNLHDDTWAAFPPQIENMEVTDPQPKVWPNVIVLDKKHGLMAVPWSGHVSSDEERETAYDLPTYPTAFSPVFDWPPGFNLYDLRLRFPSWRLGLAPRSQGSVWVARMPKDQTGYSAGHVELVEKLEQASTFRDRENLLRYGGSSPTDAERTEAFEFGPYTSVAAVDGGDLGFVVMLAQYPDFIEILDSPPLNRANRRNDRLMSGLPTMLDAVLSRMLPGLVPSEWARQGEGETDEVRKLRARISRAVAFGVETWLLDAPAVRERPNAGPTIYLAYDPLEAWLSLTRVFKAMIIGPSHAGAVAVALAQGVRSSVLDQVQHYIAHAEVNPLDLAARDVWRALNPDKPRSLVPDPPKMREAVLRWLWYGWADRTWDAIARVEDSDVLDCSSLHWLIFLAHATLVASLAPFDEPEDAGSDNSGGDDE